MIPPTSIDGTDITGATIDGTDVQEITVDGQTVFSAGNFPTTVTSRQNDTGVVGTINGLGVAFEVKENFTSMGFRVSRNTTVTPLKFELANIDTQTVILTTSDLSQQGIGGGDVFKIDFNYVVGTTYGIVNIDATSGDVGINRNSNVFPFNGPEIDLVGRAEGGSRGIDIQAGENQLLINDVGNPDNIFG